MRVYPIFSGNVNKVCFQFDLDNPEVLFNAP